MLDLKFSVVSELQQLQLEMQKRNVKALTRGAAYIRQIARNSIKRRTKKRDGASDPGTPPHTRAGAIKRSILFAVDKGNLSAVVGASADLISRAGSAHELGGDFRGRMYPQRPFMAPALGKGQERLASFWEQS